MASDFDRIALQSQHHERVQTIMHYVNKDTLREEHRKQKYGKATGIDKVSKEEYELNLEENLENLLARMKRFSYKPQAVRRTYIPKAGSDKMRPLGIPAYGFRKRRDCHQAIREINQTVMTKKVNFVVDADIKGFFDNVDHRWLMKFLEHDIQDKNFLRYIVRFLKSGIMEDLKYYESDKGTPQGGLISPVLANVYLHYFSLKPQYSALEFLQVSKTSAAFSTVRSLCVSITISSG